MLNTPSNLKSSCSYRGKGKKWRTEGVWAPEVNSFQTEALLLSKHRSSGASLPFCLEQWFSARGNIPAPQWTRGNVSRCSGLSQLGTGHYWHLLGERPWMLLNILHCTRQPHNKELSGQNVTGLEKSWFKAIRGFLCKPAVNFCHTHQPSACTMLPSFPNEDDGQCHQAFTATPSKCNF